MKAPALDIKRITYTLTLHAADIAAAIRTATRDVVVTVHAGGAWAGCHLAPILDGVQHVTMPAGGAIIFFHPDPDATYQSVRAFIDEWAALRRASPPLPRQGEARWTPDP